MADLYVPTADQRRVLRNAADGALLDRGFEHELHARKVMFECALRGWLVGGQLTSAGRAKLEQLPKAALWEITDMRTGKLV